MNEQPEKTDRSQLHEQMRLSAEVEKLANELENATAELVEVGGIWLAPGAVRSMWSESGKTMIDGIECELPLAEAVTKINALRSRYPS